MVEFDAMSGSRLVPDRDSSTAIWVGIPQRVIAMLESERIRMPVIA
jgi:hypothetical protein